jgi:hypothetical protein
MVKIKTKLIYRTDQNDFLPNLAAAQDKKFEINEGIGKGLEII